ncbi:hypothetical protein PINS_up020629 [Pythium insidiosum]|nr:hypothetical protein PINS_up020629 [Pythium insidiosum]
MSKIPFSDYFEIETALGVQPRWQETTATCRPDWSSTFSSRHGSSRRSNSSTVAESREVFEDWAKLAILHIQETPSSTAKIKTRQMSVETNRQTLGGTQFQSGQPHCADSISVHPITSSSIYHQVIIVLVW